MTTDSKEISSLTTAQLVERFAADARRMLARLSGRQHQVITGICLKRGVEVVRDCAATKVWFAPMSAREIEEYVASGEPMDKAGAYAIQGLASKFIQRIDGCYFNVVGLPVALVFRNLHPQIPVDFHDIKVL